MRETEIFPVGYKHEIARKNFQSAVLDGIPKSTYHDYTEMQLDDPAKIWGYREKGKGTWRQLHSGDYLLFYPGDKEYRYAARISGKEQNLELGSRIFRTPDEPFKYIVYFDTLYEISLDSEELHKEFAGYKIGHPVKSQPFNDQTYEAIQRRYGSVTEYIDAHREDNSASPDVVVSTDELQSEEKASDAERPKRTEAKVNRIIRNTTIVRELKDDYNHRCQLCGEKRQKASSEPYAEGHHLHPLGHSPPGLDARENIIVLCPNHHSDFDYGMVRIDTETLEVHHAYDDEVDGKQLTVRDDHPVETEHLEYHNENIASF